MLMASGYADARSPPLRLAEASTTVAIEKAHMVIPSACVGLPAGASGPATTPRSPEIRPHVAPREGRSWRGAPGEDGLNLEKDNPQSPVRVASGRTRLHPADLAPGVVSAPRNSRGLPESRSRESRPTTRRPLNLTAATAGGATHRPAVRRPDPSALLAGTPTRISRSNRVGPRGERNLEGGRGTSRRCFRWPDAYAQLRTVELPQWNFR